MSALEHAKAAGVKAAIEKIASLGIREYGVFSEDLAGKWKRILGEGQHELKLAAALNNSDTRRVFLELLKSDADKVFEGMQAAGYVLGAGELVLYLPKEEEELKKELESRAKTYGIRIENAFVNVREWQGHGLHHIATMAEVADAFLDSYQPGTYLAVCQGAETGELKRIPYGTKLNEIAELDKAKAVEIGTKLYTVSEAEECIIDEGLNTGDGVVTVIPESSCLMQEAEKRLLISRKNGCGKCTFCREGLNQLYGHMTDITSGKGKKEGLDMMKEIGEAMRFSCGCSVGTVGADFTLGAMEGFMSEFDAHIKKRNCPAGVCTCFMTIYIDPNICEGCEECADVCPEECIEGKAGYIHMIDDFDCTKCGKCIEACEYDAVVQTTGRVPKLPSRLVKCGKFKKR